MWSEKATSGERPLRPVGGICFQEKSGVTRVEEGSINYHEGQNFRTVSSVNQNSCQNEPQCKTKASIFSAHSCTVNRSSIKARGGEGGEGGGYTYV